MSEEFDKVPKDFLKDKFLVPHNFNDPENLDHAQYLHTQLREDLFNMSYNKIQRIEMKNLKDDDDFFRLKQIKECQNKNSNIQDFFSKRLAHSVNLDIFKEDELIRCEDWIIQFRDEQQQQYRVQIIQIKGENVLI